MMRPDTPYLHLWRLVLEADSPLSIATGRGDGERDSLLASDANGLPCIPGSSLAGVLRAQLRKVRPELVNSLFGNLTASGDEVGRIGSGAMSRLSISHAHIHDHTDCPVTGLRESIDDPLLAPLLTRRHSQRPRVRLNHRGVAHDGGLFDRSVLPAGHRFTVELALWSAESDDESRQWIEQTLARNRLAVGGLTRSGLGALNIVRAHARSFDLRQPGDLAAYSALPVDLAADHELPAWTPRERQPAVADAWQHLVIDLTPEGGLRIGGGIQSFLGSTARPNVEVGLHEPRVDWSRGRGQLRDDVQTARTPGTAVRTALIPGTAIKGALAHRVAFHAWRLSGDWADAIAAGSEDATPASVQRLFGRAGDATRSEVGQAGVLRVPDAWIEPERLKPKVRMHNHIDRFTGGVREGLLFGTEDLYVDHLRICISFDAQRFAAVHGQDLDLHALRLAVEDLCQGRLALGADAAGGLGFFQGRASWGDGFDWPQAPIREPLASTPTPSRPE